MTIKKINERMSEGNLNIIGIMGLNNLCHYVSPERVEYLIQLYNDSSSCIEDYEICFLINYVARGRVECVEDKEYALYEDAVGRRMILSKEDIEKGNYSIYEDRDIDAMKIVDKEALIDKIIKDLEKEGFEFLETKDYLLAFCKERNIVFYSDFIDDVLKYYGSSRINFFQQPKPSFLNPDTTVVTFYPTLDKCNKEKYDFPLFTEFSYLWLYDRKDDKDTVFNSSMKRIAKYPKLYNAVGEDNRKLIDSIVSSPEESPIKLVR